METRVVDVVWECPIPLVVTDLQSLSLYRVVLVIVVLMVVVVGGDGGGT